MKRIFVFLITMFMANISFGQTANYKTAFDNFLINYNEEKFDEIFKSFSLEMQNALPIKNTKSFLSDLKNQAGNIKSGNFVGYEQKKYASFKTEFDKGNFAVNISLDSSNKINGFFIQPFKDKISTKNNTINFLSSYPTDISKIIFSKTSDLPNGTQLSIAIIENGKTNYYGVIKINDTIKPIKNQNKIFEIGSLTKVFTSTVLAKLVTEKKISLDDNINAFYPFKFKDDIKINFKNLANHTSGLPRLPDNLDLTNVINPYKDYDKNKIEDYLKNKLKLENEPSKKYSYSNLGAGILGYTLGLSQKTSFQNLAQKYIFGKYDMKNSFTSSKKLGKDLIKGLKETGETASNWDFDVLFGGGGILSTIEDLSKFANAQFDVKNKELELTRLPTFVINEKMKIGLGWHILKSENGNEFYWHNGGTGGYSSSMSVDLHQKKSVIILANVAGINDKIDALNFELLLI
ncbi:serine hydrolase [Halpernia frigidisoli]|uniref:CubicO group peptidase, beta-lactamase class C family n=1 Tax=Halpernia frigidisoli TaxID=1125876 RepID=A0A1I3H455_9FLAO|nr:serine hydrolase [Halpernia frigidisoli]SFI30568.1 CubicO group peptidase, beta-lactamase class C family [Halpernia frigidisoli]